MFVRIFLSFAVIVLAANLLLSALMYANYERHSIDLVQSYNVEELSQISYSTNFMFEAAKLALLQLYGNPAVLKLMNYDDLSELETSSLLRQVGVVSLNLPIVNSIYIYNKNADRMYFDGMSFPLASFPDRDIVSRLQQDGEIRSLHPMARRIPTPANYSSSPFASAPTTDVYTFVFVDTKSLPIPNAIVLNVSQEWMKRTIESMNPATSGETLIADAGGRIMLGNERFGYLDNIHDSMDLRDILQQSDASGYDVKTIDGKKVLITYVSSAIQDWKYIRITPYEAVSGSIKQLTLVTVTIFVLVTVVSVLAVLLISRSVQGQFNRRISEIKKKYEMDKHTGYEKKQQFLRTLATRAMEESLLKKRFAWHGIRLPLDRSVLVIVFKIDYHDRYCSRYSLESQALLAYGMMNIMDELAEPYVKQETVDLGDGFIGMLVALELEETSLERVVLPLESLVEDIQAKTLQYLDVSLSAAVGDRPLRLDEVPGGIGECKEALDYKLFQGPRAVLCVSAIQEMKQKEYVFPESGAREILDFLLAGDRDAAYAGSRSLIEGARGYSIASLQTAVLQLAMAMKAFRMEFPTVADVLDYHPLIDIANRIPNYETLDEIIEKVQEPFGPVFDRLARSRETLKKQDRYRDIMDQVQQFLEEEFANPNLSPEMIADRLGISAKYLRTLYKKASGESLGEVITRYRMSRAKSFLEDPDASVQEVAIRSGFTNINYFYTLFKKYNGITPNEFRSIKLTKPNE